VLRWQKDRVVFVLKEGISPTSLLTKKSFSRCVFWSYSWGRHDNVAYSWPLRNSGAHWKGCRPWAWASSSSSEHWSGFKSI